MNRVQKREKVPQEMKKVDQNLRFGQLYQNHLTVITYSCMILDMTIYYLYKKTHSGTGMMYLGQTKRDPFEYRGSGIDWLSHLRDNGKSVTTEVLIQTNSRKELNYWGRYYSLLWNVVGAMDDYGNKIWANRIPETGGGGTNIIPWCKGKKFTEDQKKNLKGRIPYNKGIPMRDSSKQKLRDLRSGKSPEELYGETRGKEIRRKNSEWHLGRKNSESHNKNIGDGKRGIPQKQVTCPHCGVAGGICVMQRHHFDRCKLKKDA